MRINSRGDTIVEVMIALGVITAVMVGAYVTANRSQNASQASQERGEAIKVAESQIERLKSALTSTTPPTITDNSPFCMDDSDNSIIDINSPPPDPFTLSLNDDNLPYPGGCQKDPRYNVAIKKNESTSTFSILVRWERVGGGRDQINMYYRAH